MAERIVEKIPAIPKYSKDSLEKKKLRVAAYARVSTDSDEQLNSVEAQKDYFEKYIKRNPEWEFVGIYADEGISGTSINGRVAFAKMIEDAMTEKIDLILTKSLSRFARNTVDALNTIRMLKEKGVGIYFEKENIDTLDSKGEFLITLMSSLAEEESRSLSENVKWGKRKRFAEGKHSLGYKNFLGYKKGEKGTLVVDEEEAVIVRRIYGMCIEGYSTGAIARILTKQGIPTPMGKDEWQRSVIKSILTNEKYYGAALLQKSFVPDYRTHRTKKNKGELPMYFIADDHEGIVTKEIFDYAQEIMSKTPPNRRNQKLFSNKLYCKDCGNVYVPKLWHSTSYRNVVWECESSFEGRNTCKGPHLYEVLLKKAFHSVIIQVLRKNPSIVKKCVAAIKEVSKGNNDINSKKIYKTIANADVDTDAERTIYWVAVDKVIVNEDCRLDFYIVDDTCYNYQIEKTTPISKRLSQKTKEEIIVDYDSGMRICDIASKYKIKFNTARECICRYKKKKDHTEK